MIEISVRESSNSKVRHNNNNNLVLKLLNENYEELHVGYMEVMELTVIPLRSNNICHCLRGVLFLRYLPEDTLRNRNLKRGTEEQNNKRRRPGMT